MKKVEEFWEYYPEPRDATYFKDEYGGVDIDKVFKFAEEYASQSQPQPVSVSEEVKNVLLKEKDSGRMTEATYRFLMRNISTHQPTKIDEGKIEEALDDFSSGSMKEWDGYKDHRNKAAQAIAKLINGGTIMKTGIELIAKERQEQIGKHKWDEDHDSEHREGQLAIAAEFAINPAENPNLLDAGYSGWEEFEEKIIHKGYKERLIIAGALIAAEIDRINLINGGNEG